MAGERSVRVKIHGVVQGVNFRAWTKRRAEALGLSGWVRNLAEGSVEAIFSGSADAVETMLAECRQGPRHAAVTKVEALGPVTEAVPDGFVIRRDG